MKEKRVIISGGGTGGHFYPALVVGKKLVEMDENIHLTYVGTRRDTEKKIMREYGVAYRPLRIEGLKARGIKSLRGLMILPLAFAQSLALIIRIRPVLVIGVGGYSSGPVVLLASWLRIPTLILEQNSRPGFTNRLLARWVKKAAVSFASSLPYFKEKGIYLGNPVREEFYTVGPRRDADGLSLLVFGGSQGSHFLNERVTGALAHLARRRESFRIFHQTGPKDLAWVSDRYLSSGFSTAVISAYFTDMPSYFDKADLILSRAGATTLAEIIAARRAAILVPFASAAEDHQTANARELENEGAAELISEERATPEFLAERILFLLDHKERLKAMERALEALRTENSAQKIADLSLSLMKGREKEMSA